MIMKLSTEMKNLMTDYALGIVGGVCAFDLYVHAQANPSTAINLWAIAFIFISLGAFLGGTYHGSLGVFSESKSKKLWRLMVYSLELASFSVLSASAAASLSGTALSVLILVAIVKLAISAGVLTFSDQFKPVMYDYGISLVIAAVLYGFFVGGTGAIWVIFGIVLALIGSGMQAFGLKLSRYFDHNDAYHIIEAIALVCIYWGIQ